MAEEETKASSAFRFVCKLADLAKSGSKCAVVDGRAIILFFRPCRDSEDFQIHAIDALCYHAGGPLVHGDIEDMGGSFGEVVICPWHRYRISLTTGEGFYQNLQRTWVSKGQRQRVHTVQLQNNGEDVCVQISRPSNKTAASTAPSASGSVSAPPDKVASDDYETPNMVKSFAERYCGHRNEGGADHDEMLKRCREIAFGSSSGRYGGVYGGGAGGFPAAGGAGSGAGVRAGAAVEGASTSAGAQERLNQRLQAQRNAATAGVSGIADAGSAHSSDSASAPSKSSTTSSTTTSTTTSSSSSSSSSLPSPPS